MNDNEFDSLCKANSFGAVARGELPLIPRGMLKVLVDAAYAAGLKAEREAIFIEWENGELLAAEVERLRAELAAAKAASVVPVELVALGDADWECSVGVKCKSSEDADTLYNWLRDRMKERGEG